MIGYRACYAAGVSLWFAFGAASPGLGQQLVRTPPGRTGQPVPRLSVEQTRAAVLGLLPELAEVPIACPRPEGKSNAMAIEVEGVELVRRMKAYPDLAPAASLTLQRWAKNLKQRVAHCSGRKMKTGAAQGRGLEPVTARRSTQITRAGLAFARYRVAQGY